MIQRQRWLILLVSFVFVTCFLTDNSHASEFTVSKPTGEIPVNVVLLKSFDLLSGKYFSLSAEETRQKLFGIPQKFIEENSYGKAALRVDAVWEYEDNDPGESNWSDPNYGYKKFFSFLELTKSVGLSIDSWQHSFLFQPFRLTGGNTLRVGGHSTTGMGHSLVQWGEDIAEGLRSETSSGSSNHVFVHEFFHQLGLFHSTSTPCNFCEDTAISHWYSGETEVTYSCAWEPYPTREKPERTGCQFMRYGDYQDPMGMSSFVHLGSFHKELLGWLTETGPYQVLNVKKPDTYRVQIYASQTPGIKALKLKRNPRSLEKEEYYYLEYRREFGLDTFGELDPFYGTQEGVTIRTGDLNHSDSSSLLGRIRITHPKSWLNLQLKHEGQQASEYLVNILSMEPDYADIKIQF